MNAIEQLKSVLCDQEGKCCIRGSDADRAIVDRALEELTTPQQAEAVPVLTDAEIDEAADDDDPDCDYVCGFYNGARWAETRLRGIVGKEGA